MRRVHVCVCVCEFPEREGDCVLSLCVWSRWLEWVATKDSRTYDNDGPDKSKPLQFRIVIAKDVDKVETFGKKKVCVCVCVRVRACGLVFVCS